MIPGRGDSATPRAINEPKHVYAIEQDYFQPSFLETNKDISFEDLSVAELCRRPIGPVLDGSHAMIVKAVIKKRAAPSSWYHADGVEQFGTERPFRRIFVS